MDKIKSIEAFFRPDLVSFLHDLNLLENSEAAYQLLVRFAEELGFPTVVYEYCNDHTREEEKLFMRTNLPVGFKRLEDMFAGKHKIGPGRMHARNNLTMAVTGVEFADLFSADKTYSRKLQLAGLLTGMRSGFGIPLRTPNPLTRAGFGFGSKMKRELFEEALERDGLALCVAAWHTHMKILQTQAEQAPRRKLTAKQSKYLELLCEGLLDKQISEEMGISHSGVRKFQTAVSAKFGVTQRAQIVSEAYKQGYLDEGGVVKNPEKSDIWDFMVVVE
jgi:DNA-binding CsgD family transcriptional regulator